MAGDGWASVRLGDVCTKIGSGATPRGGSGVYLDSGPYALIRSQNVHNDGFRREGLAFIGEEHAAELSNVEVLRDDVLLNITGDSVARCCQVEESVLPARVNQHVAIVRPNPEKLDPRFLRYFLVSPDMQAQLLSWAGAGGTRNALTKAMIESFEVVAPGGVDEQRAIAGILGSLDDKIELNRRMNETLEAIARALFKSWFVDFDPVRARAEGRAPSLPRHLADLFPDSFEESELGEIPAGWRTSTVGAELVTVLGGTPSRAVPSYWEGGAIPWINSGTANEFRVTEPSEFITQEGMDRSATKLMPERTTIIAITGATLGQVSLLEIEACANQSIVGLLGSAAIPGEFIYFWVKERIGELISWQTGGAQQHINKNNVNDLRLLRPSEHLMQAYLRVARPIFDRVKANCFESRTLAALRDMLLPKLLSGEIRVKGAKRMVEEVV